MHSKTATLNNLSFLKTREKNILSAFCLFQSLNVHGSEMPHRCVVYGCSNIASQNEGISLHNKIPYANDDRPEAKKRRKRWFDFVKRKRPNFEPTASSKICSRHFMAEDFVRPFAVGLTTEKPKLKQLL